MSSDYFQLDRKCITLCILMIISPIMTVTPSIDRVGDYCARNPPTHFVPREGSGGTLRSVQVLFRHGARGDHQKTQCFQNGTQTDFKCRTRSVFGLSTSDDQLTARKFRPITIPRLIKVYEGSQDKCSQGQLLDLGVVQVTKLGKFLKSAYPDVFTNMNLLNTFLYSTDTQRTFATLHVLLSTLYPSSKPQDPFQVHTRDFTEDFFALNIPWCKKFVDLRTSFHQTDAYRDIIESANFKECQALWISEFGTPLALQQADDCLLSAYCSKSNLPSGKLVDSKLLKCVTDASFELRAIKLGGVKNNSYTDDGQKICQFGSFQVIKAIKDSVFNHNHVAGLYSIHDETFVCFLTSFGLWDGVWPKYTSFIALEFYSDGVIRVLRDGEEIGTLDDRMELTLFKDETEIHSFCDS